MNEGILLSTVVEVTGGGCALDIGPAAQVLGVSTDSRDLRAGELFVALEGERFDGHDFLDQAFARGAAACLVRAEHRRRAARAAGRRPVIAVADPLEALERLAAWRRRAMRCHVIAVTGSVGKTTTKEFLRTLLARRFATFSAPRSFNNRLGVALTLLGTPATAEQLIVEVGTSGPGEIGHLSRIVRPHRVVITSVAPAHLQGLGSLEGVAAAKAEIFEGLEPGGTAHVLAAVAALPVFRARLPERVLTFGWEDAGFVPAACRPRGRPRGGGAFRAGHRFRVAGEELEIRVPGRHNVLNATAAASVARELGLGWSEIRRGLGRCRLPPGRLQLEELGGVLVLDDSYNANPASLEAALEAFAELPPPAASRRVLVLGDMLELGPASRRLHEECGRRAAAEPVDLLATVGEASRLLGQSYREARREEALHFDSPEECLEFLRRSLRPGDQVLLKGSNRSGLGQVAAGLREWLHGLPSDARGAEEGAGGRCGAPEVRGGGGEVAPC